MPQLFQAPFTPPSPPQQTLPATGIPTTAHRRWLASGPSALQSHWEEALPSPASSPTRGTLWKQRCLKN